MLFVNKVKFIFIKWMKKFSYLNMVRELLTEKEFLDFEKQYTGSVQKSVKVLKSRLNFSELQEVLFDNEWTLSTPKFSYSGNMYDDVLFVEKQDKQSL